MSGPKNGILARWGSSSLNAVELPSGMRALVKLPNPAQLAMAGSLPEELRELASKYASGGITISEVKPDELPVFLRFMYELMAGAVKYLAEPGSGAWEAFKASGGDPVDEGWQVVSLTGSELRELDISQPDLDALGLLVGRMSTFNEITFASRRDRGLLEPDTPVPPKDGETVPDFATFRRQPASSERGDHGEDVRAAAVGAAGDRRPGSRVRRRRGAGD